MRSPSTKCHPSPDITIAAEVREAKFANGLPIRRIALAPDEKIAGLLVQSGL
ncbi:hypothetical protein I6F35_17175 [Bradyrhizobium sp. BRP22]|uniref:hypothetical protein n=1 Tax=Bradyrhizobium sp. BRP22 TaxID=2793821 RepID=UPI001CD3198E|nr:hypothetical protein [Bradyrhizobium sp. BRP22]MCA1454940.1 hypothetical protein [Bradyrhizobium sp. BRP22]